MLPKIVFGGQEFWDISSIVTPNRYIRPGTDGLAIHHSVGQTEFPDRNANGTSMDEQIEHIKAIDRFHIAQGYGGFGYNGIGFRDGAVYTVGRCEGARAHVAHENNHLAGLCMAGTFTVTAVPFGLILGGGRWLYAMEREYGVTTVKGHRDWVRPENKPQWATACPGDRGVQAIGQMQMVRAALHRNDNAALEAEARRHIAEALNENVQAANLDGLAAQIKFLTGGRLC